MSKLTYTSDVTPSFGLPWQKEYFVFEKGGIEWREGAAEKVIAEKGREAFEHLEKIRVMQPILSEVDPIKYGWRGLMYDQIVENWHDSDVIVIFGGEGCLDKDELIYDPVDGSTIKVSERNKPFHVLSHHPKEGVVIRKASPAYRKQDADLFQVKLETGEQFSVSGDHQVLTPFGYEKVKDLVDGGAVLSPPSSGRPSLLRSILGTFPSALRQGALRLKRTVQGYLDGCSAYFHQCGEQLQCQAALDLASSPSRGDVLGHTSEDERNESFLFSYGLFSLHRSGVLASMFQYIRSCLWSFRHSNACCRGLSEHRTFDILCRAFCRLCRLALRLSLGLLGLIVSPLSVPAFFLRKSFRVFAGLGSLLHRVSAFRHIASITPKCKGQIWDFEVLETHNYIHKGAVHHNSGKSFTARSILLDIAEKIPEFKAVCFHHSRTFSVDAQQSHVRKGLKKEYVDMMGTKTPSCNIRWSDDKGFPSDSLMLPPLNDGESGRIIRFNYYSQYRNNKEFMQGWHNIHLFWFDEEAPLDLVHRSMSRMREVNGKIIITFTTLNAYTDLVKAILKNAETIEEKECSMTVDGKEIKEMLPIHQRSNFGGKCNIFYLHSKENPFVVQGFMESKYRDSSYEIQKARLFGVPTNAFNSMFGAFDEDVHVIKHEDIPFIKDPSIEHTRWASFDPAPSKPWCWVKFGVVPNGKDHDGMPKYDYYAYEEFPDMDTYGSWGEPKDANKVPVGEPGPAHRYPNAGPIAWSRMIKEWPDFHDMHALIMDKRFAGSPTASKSGGSITHLGSMAEYDIYFTPSRKMGPELVEIERGLDMMKDAFYYDRDRDISETNRPSFYISEKCGNFIKCVKEFKNCSRDEIWKDFIDCGRFFFTFPPYHCPRNPDSGDYGHQAGGY